MGDFTGSSFLDGDFAQAVANRPIDGGRGQGDVKRDVVVVGGERLEVGADFVANIAVGGGAVGAHDDEVNLAVLHEVAAGVIDDDGVGYAMVKEFPSREAGALVTGTGFVDPDVDFHAGIVREINRCSRGSPVNGGEPSGVAVGKNIERLARWFSFREYAQEWKAGLADGLVDGDVFVAKGSGESAGCIGTFGGWKRF